MKIAICEDTQRDQQQLLTILNDYLFQHNLMSTIDCFQSAETFLARFKPGEYQLLFMDIYFKDNEANGLEIAEKIYALDPEIAIIFTTNYDHFGVQGYKVALYYILKPVTMAELTIGMKKCWRQIEQLAKTITITVNRQVRTLPLKSILYIESQRRNCLFITTEGTITANITIEALKAELQESSFFRCHRSFIVNFFYVKTILGNEFLMLNEHRVPISRTYKKEILTEFESYLRLHILGKNNTY